MATLDIRGQEDGLISCYSKQILPAKTRRILLLGRKCEPKLMYTFLGFEVKLGNKRLTCPDMTTARYLRVFGRIGAESVEMPYDPTLTARVLPLLEKHMESIDELLASSETRRVQRQRRAQRVYRRIRQRLKDAERNLRPSRTLSQHC
jgi:hypothetical protein